MHSRLTVFALLGLMGLLLGGSAGEALARAKGNYRDSDQVLESLLPDLAREKLTAYEARLLRHATLRKPRPNGKRLRDAMPDEKPRRRARAADEKRQYRHHDRDFLLE